MKNLGLFLAVLAALAFFATPALAQDVAAPGGDCDGPCSGVSVKTSTGTKKCEDMTAAEITALKKDACDKTSKSDARRNANDMCDDGSGTCLCTGGTFTNPSAQTTNENGKCVAICSLQYQGGRCNVVAAAAPDGTASPEGN